MNESARRCEEQIISLFLKNGTEEENAEYVMADVDTVICIKQQGLLFLPDGNLPEQYGRAGFHRAYLDRCYQMKEKHFTEEKSSKEQEN